MGIFKIVSIGFTAMAAMSAAALAQNEQESITATPAMWRAADADTEIFMLGTFHILPKGIDWRTEAFETAFNKADRVYFEVETDAPDTQSKTIGVLMTQGFNADGKLLTDILNQEDGARLRQIVTSLGLPFQGVNPMRPWNAFLTLSVQFIVNQGFDPASGVDSVLTNEARTKGKTLRFFETLEQQLAFFTELPPETEKALLELTIRDWDEQAESFDDLFAAWRNGDTAFIDNEMNSVMAQQAPEVFETLIIERNQNWTEELTKIMKEETGTVFVAVGAAHLVGEHSVPAMLTKEGIEVSRYGADPTAANDNAAASDETDAIGELLKATGEQ